MAGNAGRRRRGNVHSRQGKPRRRVIKYRSCPGRCRMAGLAGLRERSRNMIRHRASERRGALPGSYVATVAGCRTEQIVVAYMAGKAGRRGRGNVHPRQGKPGRAVVERRCGPTHRRMAHRTVRCGKLRARRFVHGVIRAVPGC